MTYHHSSLSPFSLPTPAFPTPRSGSPAAVTARRIFPPACSREMESDDIVGGDKLILRGLKFHGFHGVKPEERSLGQKFIIDVDAWMDLRPAGTSDQLEDTVSYTAIYRIVKEVVEGAPQNLLESVGQRIATATLTEYPRISAVRVKVGKPHVAVHGSLDYLGIEIVRRRCDVSLKG